MALGDAEKRDEAYYIIGLDIGNDSSGIAFYNLADGAPEPIDLSGGYGRPTIPTVAQYIAETKEWVFGEYAALNRGAGNESTFEGLIGRLGRNEYVDVGKKPVSVVSVLALYIRELLGHVKNINPKAEIVGIVASVPSYSNPQAREDYARAFKQAGYEKELIALVSDRECVFSRHYAANAPKDETILLLDYGSGEVRGGLYRAAPDASEIKMACMSSLFDDNIGTSRLNTEVEAMFKAFYLENSPDASGGEVSQIPSFAYMHRDMLFQKNIRSKPVKLYFNFAYPPFMQSVSHGRVMTMVKPYAEALGRFVRDVLDKNLYSGETDAHKKVESVICVGGGFEMLWAKETVCETFPGICVAAYKNAKTVASEGAAVTAATLLGVASGKRFEIEDRHQLKTDIGILSGGGFIPLVERNAFWWQKHPAKIMLLNEPCGGRIFIPIASRASEGGIRRLAELPLDGLPARPKGVTRLCATLSFQSDGEFSVTLSDCGFGELFPKTDYTKEFNVKIA